jgi:formylglycine-generating enzyme required for sulfatase activity/tetratricopeptide (TPR) repeat protein
MRRLPLFAAFLIFATLESPLFAQASLAWRWQEKDQFYVEWKAHMLTARKTAGQEGNMDEEVSVVYRVTVLKQLPDRGVELEAFVESVQAKTVPARVDPRLLEGETLRAAFDSHMNITRLDGVDALMQKRFGAGALPPHAKFVRMDMEDLCRSLFQDAFVPLPGRAVTAGEQWEQQTIRTLAPIGTHVLKKTFATDAKEPGRVVVTGASTLTPFAEGAFGLPYKVADPELKSADYRGFYLFDAAAGRLKQGETLLRTRVSATMVGDGVKLPGDATQEHTTTVRFFESNPLAVAGSSLSPGTAGLDKEVINSVGMKLVLIPAGRFMMGALPTEEGRLQDETYCDVQISRPFYLGAYEVTRGQFRRFVEATGYQTDAEKSATGAMGYNEQTGQFEASRLYSWRNTGYPQADDHPVVNVSWEDAKAFCEWLSRTEGKTYRLPSEAEWEYACRAGTTTRYWSGDREEDLLAVDNVADAALKRKFPSIDAARGEDGDLFTVPVGKRRANPWGLFDMHGNVTEWCADLYGATLTGGRDPDGPPNGSQRVQRGGSWSDGPRDCRAARRPSRPPHSCNSSTGFRVVLLTPAPALAAAPPPARGILTGQDARRAEELHRQAEEFAAAGRFAEALVPAREEAALRAKVQGDKNWQAADAARTVTTLEKLNALPEADRAAFLALPAQLNEAVRLSGVGRQADAQAVFEQVLATRERLLGPDHPANGKLYDQLALASSVAGKHVEAASLARRALEIFRRALGEEHPATGQAYHNLAGHLVSQGKLADAEPLFRRGLAINLAVLGEDDVNTARSYDSLGTCLNDLGKPVEAQPMHEKALAVFRQRLGDDDAHTIQCRHHLAINRLSLNRPADAEVLLRSALESQRRTSGEDNFMTAVNYSNLATSLLRQGKHAEAEPALRRSAEIRARVLGESHPETLQAYGCLGTYLKSQGKTEEGDRILRSVEELRRRSQGG